MTTRIMLNETSYHGAGAIQEIAAEAKSRGYQKLLFTAGNERARKKHDVRISLLILHRVVSFLQL